MKKFYLVCFVINIMLIWSIFYILLSYQIISNFLFDTINTVFNVDREYLERLFLLFKLSGLRVIDIFFVSIFSVFSPIAVLLFKNYKYHWLLFLIINFLLVLLSIYFNYNNMYKDSLIFNALFFSLFCIIISFSVHFCQMIIGKKLLPTRYFQKRG